MAVTKPTTTKDLTNTGEAAGPTLQDQVEQVTELTHPDVVADAKAPRYVRVKSPAGAVTQVPEGIVDALVESGYSKTK